MHPVCARFLPVALGILAAVPPVRAQVELVQKITETTNNPVISRKGGFIHAFPITWRGGYLYVATHYEGYINIFQRDLGTGRLTRLDALSFDDARDMSIEDFTWIGSRLYFYGTAGHCTGDGDARGLRWVEADDATGKLAIRGNLQIPLASGLVRSKDRKNLFLLLPKQRKIVQYRLLPDGTPERAGEAALADATADVGCLSCTDDGRRLFAMQFPGQPEPGQPVVPAILFAADVKPDGGVAYAGATRLEELTQGLAWVDKNGKKAGWGWGAGPAGCSWSPDGRDCYVFFTCARPRDPPPDFKDENYRRIALYRREPGASQVKFVELLDVTDGGKGKPGNLVFEPDGTIGYSSDGLWVTRDPQTGRLAYGGRAKDVGEARPYLDAENGYLYGGCWAHQQLTVMRTGRKTAAAETR
jgi:hypothetical protein